MGQLICSFQFPFRSIPVQFNWGTEREWNGNGTGTEGEWSGNGTERNRNGTEMEQKFNGRSINAQFKVPGLLYDCIQSGGPKSSFHCPFIELFFHFRSIPVLFHSCSIPVPFPFKSCSIPVPFPIQCRSYPVQFPFNWMELEWNGTGIEKKQMSWPNVRSMMLIT